MAPKLPALQPSFQQPQQRSSLDVSQNGVLHSQETVIQLASQIGVEHAPEIGVQHVSPQGSYIDENNFPKYDLTNLQCMFATLSYPFYPSYNFQIQGLSTWFFFGAGENFFVVKSDVFCGAHNFFVRRNCGSSEVEDIS